MANLYKASTAKRHFYAISWTEEAPNTEARSRIAKEVSDHCVKPFITSLSNNNNTHITNYLDDAREQMQHEYKERHEKKIFTAILVGLVLVFLVIVILLLKDNPDVLEKIIYSVGGIVAGAFGGYGFGRQKSQEDE